MQQNVEVFTRLALTNKDFAGRQISSGTTCDRLPEWAALQSLEIGKFLQKVA
jgi:hypothetical protein